MAFVDPHNNHVLDLSQDIIFVHTACARGRMSGLFTVEILYEQNGGADKVTFPYNYTSTTNSEMICTCTDPGDSVDFIPISAIHLTTT